MKKLLSCACLLSALCATSTQASIFDDIGYTKLKTELGVNVPDGTGVKVTHVEASSGGAWIPDVTNAQFVGKTINLLSPNPNGVSGHATSMGLRFYGTISTTSPGISDIDVFETNDWLVAGFLKAGSVTTVSSATRRIANHSWVGDAAGNNIFYLAKLDYVIEADEFVQVVAMSADPSANHLFSDSFNAIVAGMTHGGGIGTTLVSGAYKADRTRPDITAPESIVSAATPRIASAAALLVDYAHSNPALSTDPSVKSTTNVVGNVIYNAERSETIKAILMAGADRTTVGNTNPTFDIDPDPAIKTLIPVDITDYRVDIANQTNNGLDKRFGAGQLNIYNSYHILKAKEQNSEEDEPVASGAILNSGFDYDPAFGGQGGSNSTASYYFSTNANSGQKLKADLVWNIEIANPQTSNSEKLYDLDLQLIDVTGGNAIVASSNSGIDNTENIWFDLLSNRSYRLEVIRGSGQAAFNWDYALAWQIVVPGITVEETLANTITEEAGAVTDTFTLVLDTQPAGDVLIAITSSDESEATILPTSVTFTSSDWDVPQTIVITGVDDAVDDGDVPYSISFTVSSVADADYHGFILSSVSASNIDDDVTPSVDAGQSFSIDENSVISSLLGVVTETSPTSIVSAYTIFSGDDGGVFDINSSGDLTVAGVVDYEMVKSYVLGIKVSDGVNESLPTDVAITVNNINDVAPVIAPLAALDINENIAIDTDIATVVATDVDSTVTGFTIENGNTNNAFTIDKNGVLTVAAVIDYEATKTYTLSITASDDFNTSIPVAVVINVGNLDETAPVIASAQSFNIDENSTVSTVVNTVAATDAADAGGVISSFTIVSGNTANAFAISNKGVITVVGTIDHEITTSYTLSITATDDSNNISNAVDVVIDVNNLDDTAPLIASAQSFNIDENSTVSTAVGTVAAIDAADAGGVVSSFTIVSGNTANAFAISSNGVITVVGTIDYEITTSYTLSIMATDDSNNLSNSVDVVIDVNNLDDIAPVIASPQSFNIDENSTVSTVVGTVAATDVADAGGVVSSFTIVSGNTANAFAISNKGVITVVGTIDYEITTSYTLSITATDDSNNISNAVDVVIDVNDFNDTAPVVGASQSFNVDENSDNGTVLGTVLATDVDSVIAGFNIVNGNIDNAFAIDANGEITLSAPIDYETTRSYTLSITASDGVNTSAPVNVGIVVNSIIESSGGGGGGGGGGSLNLMWLVLPFFITVCRRRVLH